MQCRPLIFVVISVLVVALVYSSSLPPLIVFAEPMDPGYQSSTDCGTVPGQTGINLTWCCWYEGGVKYCQTCVPIPKGTPGTEEGGFECTKKEKQSLEQPPTPQPSGPAAPLQGGVLEQPPSPPSSGPVAPLKGGILEQLEQGNPEIGFSERQQPPPPPADQRATELPPPVTEETQPATLEDGSLPPCPEGQVLDEETGLCVLEEPEAAEQSEQSTEDGDGSEDNSGSN